MELRSGRARWGSAPRLALVCCVSLCLFSISALLAGAGDGGAHLDIRSSRADSHAQRERGQSGEAAAGRVGRRKLGAVGSYPPRCAAKCGECTPCWPVHVPIPPGAVVTTMEYYPEAWRCRCGNRLYMP